MTWGAIASTAITVGAGMYQQSKAKKAAGKAQAAATPHPWGTATPYGNILMDEQGRMVNASMADNPFFPLLNVGGQAMLANAFSAPGSAYYGAPPELAAAAAGFDPMALQQSAMDRTAQLNALAAPGEQQQRVALDDQLFARGQLGTTGGTERFKALMEAQNTAGLQRQMAGFDFATSNALNRLNAANQAIQTGGNLATSQYNMGTGAFSGMQNYINNFLQSGNLGLSAGGMNAAPWQAAVNTAQTPGAFASLNQGLQQAGVYDKFGDWIGGKLGGGGSTAPAGMTPQQQFPLNLSFSGMWGQ